MYTNGADSEARFAGFRYVGARRCLARDDGTEVTLRPKSLETFRHLAAHADRVAGRETLHRAIWGRTVVTDDSLGKCIAEIRHAIGDTRHEVLRTVPRHGYMLIADRPVAAGAADGEGEAVPGSASIVPPASAVGGGRGTTRWPWRTLAVALTVALAVALALTQHTLRGPVASAPVSIASGAAPVSSEGVAEAVEGVPEAVLTAIPSNDGEVAGAASDTLPGDGSVTDAPRGGRRPTVSLRTAAPGDPVMGTPLDALVGAVRTALGRGRSVSFADTDADYDLSIALREGGVASERCLAFELRDARGRVVFADAYPIDELHGAARAYGAGSDAFWQALFARVAACAPSDAASAAAPGTDRVGPQRERQAPTLPIDDAASPRRRGRLSICAESAFRDPQTPEQGRRRASAASNRSRGCVATVRELTTTTLSPPLPLG